MNSDEKTNDVQNAAKDPARRELMEKFGKFAAYAAPFTVLALAEKADAATGTGPVKHTAHH
jgi:hypothetical protein